VTENQQAIILSRLLDASLEVKRTALQIKADMDATISSLVQGQAIQRVSTQKQADLLEAIVRREMLSQQALAAGIDKEAVLVASAGVS
jgi:hypothetical protein